MALTATTMTGAITVSDTSIVVGSATSFAAGNRIIIDQEEMKVGKSYTSGTTIPVQRGQNGTATAAHANGAAVYQGIGAADFPSTGPQETSDPVRLPTLPYSASLTITGATGSTATALPSVTPCIVMLTGTSGAGVNIPTGTAVPGAYYIIKNGTTGVAKVYAVGSTINGTTGTTAISITATGNLGAIFMCTEAGAWQSFGNT